MSQLQPILAKLRDIETIQDPILKGQRYAEVAAAVAMAASRHAPFKQSALAKAVSIANQSARIMPKPTQPNRERKQRRQPFRLDRGVERFADFISEGDGEYMIRNNAVLALARGLGRTLRKVQINSKRANGTDLGRRMFKRTRTEGIGPEEPEVKREADKQADLGQRMAKRTRIEGVRPEEPEVKREADKQVVKQVVQNIDAPKDVPGQRMAKRTRTEGIGPEEPEVKRKAVQQAVQNIAALKDVPGKIDRILKILESMEKKNKKPSLRKKVESAVTKSRSALKNVGTAVDKTARVATSGKKALQKTLGYGRTAGSVVSKAGKAAAGAAARMAAGAVARPVMAGLATAGAVGAISTMVLGGSGDAPQSNESRNTAESTFDASSVKGLSGVEKVTAKFIADEEKYAGKAYKDNKRYSVGYGHQITEEEVSQGFIQIGDQKVPVSGPMGKDTRMSKEAAEALLAQDISTRYLPQAKKAMGEAWDKMNDNQKAAVVSYTYNTGMGGTLKLVKRGLKDFIMKGQWDNAAELLGSGERMQGSQYEQGLIVRRANERKLFGTAPAAEQPAEAARKSTKANEARTKQIPTPASSTSAPAVQPTQVNIQQGSSKPAPKGSKTSVPPSRNMSPALQKALSAEAQRSF